MINIVCEACATAVRVCGDPEQMDSLFGPIDKYKCPACDGLAEEVEAIDPTALAALDVHDLTPEEAYAAFHGLGFPEEQECGPMAVNKIFEGKVKKVKGSLIKGSNRTVIYSILFEDGAELFLGSSGFGALAYRIRRPHSYTEANSG